MFLQRLLSWLGFQRTQPDTPRAAAPSSQRVPTPEPGPPPAAALPPEHVQFLLTLVDPPEVPDLQELCADDRLFLSAVMKRANEKELAIPVLPRAAVEISRLLGKPNRNITDFVRVLEADPALSVEVLRIANSSLYGFSGTTHSVQNAVMRIGLNQLRGLIVVAHLQGKILQGNSFQTEANWLSELSMGLAQVAQELAGPLGLDPNAAFTRGVLHHVEHFIVMGTASEVSRKHHRRLTLTGLGLLTTLRRVGPRVREDAARTWHLEELMLQSSDEDRATAAYAELERGLVAQWTGQELPWQLEGVTPDRLAALSARTRPHQKTPPAHPA